MGWKEHKTVNIVICKDRCFLIKLPVNEGSECENYSKIY